MVLKKETFAACQNFTSVTSLPGKTEADWQLISELQDGVFRVFAVRDDHKLQIAGPGTPVYLTRGDYSYFPFSEFEVKWRQSDDLLILPPELRKQVAREQVIAQAHDLANKRLIDFFKSLGRGTLYDCLETNKALMGVIVDFYGKTTGRQGESMPRFVVSASDDKALLETTEALLGLKYTVGFSLCSLEDPYGGNVVKKTTALRGDSNVRPGLKYCYPVRTFEQAKQDVDQVVRVAAEDSRVREVIVTGHPFWRGWWGENQNRHTAIRMNLRPEGLIMEMAVGSYHMRDIGRWRLRRPPYRGTVSLFAPWEDLGRGKLVEEKDEQGQPSGVKFEHIGSSPVGDWWNKKYLITKNAFRIVDLILTELTQGERFEAFLDFAARILPAGYDFFEFMAVHTDIGRRCEPQLGGVYLYQLDSMLRR